MLAKNYAFSGTVLLWPCSRATSPACEGDTILEALAAPGRHPLIGHLRYKGGWLPLDLTSCPPQLQRITRHATGQLQITRNFYRLAALLSAYRGQAPVAILHPQHRTIVSFALPVPAATATSGLLPGLLAHLDAEGHA